MPVDEHIGLGADDVQRAPELAVVAGQVGGEVRRLAFPPRPAAFVQVECIEGEPAAGEVISQVGVEEVVGEPVDRQHRAGGGLIGLAAAYQRGDEPALPVGISSQLERLLPVTGQHIWLPIGHDSYLSRAPEPTWADGARWWRDNLKTAKAERSDHGG